MTSTISLSKLVKNNFRRRSWLFFLTMIIGIILLPIATLLTGRASTGMDVIGGSMTTRDALFGWTVTWEQNVFLSTVTPDNLFLAMAIVVDAFLAGVNGFAYMNKGDQTDFYHSLPIKRGHLFLTSYIGGALTAVVPFVICELLCLPIAVVLRVLSGRVLLIWLAGMCASILAFLAIYEAVILAMMLTGRMLTGILLGIALVLYIPVTCTIVHFSMTAWMPNIASATYNPIGIDGTFFSPLTLLFRIGTVGNVSWWLCMLFYAVALFVLSMFLYLKRPTEVQGDTFLSPKMNPVIKVIVGVAGALVSAMFFSALSQSDQVLFMFIGAIAGVILINFVMEFIYNPDIRIACSHWKSLMVFLMASLAVVIFFVSDPLALDKSLPSEAAVEEIGVENHETEALFGYNVNFLDADQFRYAPMDGDLYEKISEIAKKSGREGRDDRNVINLQFKMKNGNEVRRFLAADKEDVLDLVEMIEKKERPRTDALVKLKKYRWGSVTVEGWQVDPDDDGVVFALRDHGKALKEALDKDRTTLTCRQAYKEGSVCMLTVYPDEKANAELMDIEQPTLRFPVYKSYERTLKVLGDLGVHLEENRENALRTTIEGLRSIDDDNGDVRLYSITNPEEMKKFLRGVVVCSEYEFAEDYRKTTNILLKEKSGSERYMCVRVDDPELLLEYHINEDGEY